MYTRHILDYYIYKTQNAKVYRNMFLYKFYSRYWYEVMIEAHQYMKSQKGDRL